MIELPSQWLDVELGEVADFIRGITYKKEHSLNEAQDKYVPVIRATNITGTALTFDGLVYVPADNVSDDQILRLGDVVIASSSGSKEIVGKAGSFLGGDFKGSFGAFCTGIRPIKGLSTKYFGYYFQTPTYRKSVSDLSAGSNINNLKSSDLASQRFSLPPVSEQSRIVEKLEELLTGLDAGVAELKAAQKKLAQYRQSLLKAAVEGALTAQWRANNSPTETGAQLLERILQERRTRWEAKQLAKFKEQGKAPPKDWQKKYPEPVQPDTTGLCELPQGWVWASVDQLVEIISGFAFSSSDFCDMGIPVTKIANIGYGEYIDEAGLQYLPPSFKKSHHEFNVSMGDLLIALTRPITNNTLKSCRYLNAKEDALLNQRVALLRMVYPDISDYLFFLTRSPYFLGSVRQSTSETLQPNMSPNALKEIAVPLPISVAEVKLVAEVLNNKLFEIDNLSVESDFALNKSSAQRQNILKAAFSGQLVAQDPSDEPASELLKRIRAERAAQQAVKKPRGRKVKEAA